LIDLQARNGMKQSCQRKSQTSLEDSGFLNGADCRHHTILSKPRIYSLL